MRGEDKTGEFTWSIGIFLEEQSGQHQLSLQLAVSILAYFSAPAWNKQLHPPHFTEFEKTLSLHSGQTSLCLTIFLKRLMVRLKNLAQQFTTLDPHTLDARWRLKTDCPGFATLGTSR